MTTRTSLLASLIVLSVAASGCTGWAWGRDLHGQIPNESATPASVGGDLVDVAAGGEFSCEIRDDRSLWCRGRNDWGQLGTGDLEPVEGTIRVGEQSDWVSITGGELHACGIRAVDELWCWGGYPHHEQNLDGTMITPNQPIEVAGEHAWRSVAPSAAHTCGITTAGALMCWGLNLWGEVGNGTTEVVEEPVTVADGSWIAVATDWTGSCAIRDDGTLWCWGAISHPYPEPNPVTPTQLGDGADWMILSGRDGHYCAIRSDHTLWCWGNTTGDSLPTQVGDDADWRDVDTAWRRTCATRLDWSLWCWGRDVFGESEPVGTPALVDDTRLWIEFELGARFTVGVTAP